MVYVQHTILFYLMDNITNCNENTSRVYLLYFVWKELYYRNLFVHACFIAILIRFWVEFIDN